MNLAPGLIAAGLAAGAGTLAGIAGSLWWARRAARKRRRIPAQWPLDRRRMASSAECQVWRWMGRVFFDHHVMLKVPVTRFTLPRDRQNSAHWYHLLSSVYCTFTVCESDGHVVGCVDVLGPHGLPSSNVQLKLALLSQCGIAYWVVKPGALPNLAEIRAEFLGDAAAASASDTRKDDAAINLARQKLRAAVGRQRHQRQGSSAGSDSRHSVSDSSLVSGAWQQPNSFIAPLDSRPTKLR